MTEPACAHDDPPADALAMYYSTALGAWIVQGYSDAVAVLRNEALEIPRLPLPTSVGTERERDALRPLWEQAGYVPLYSHGEAHRRLRRALRDAFVEGAVAARRRTVRAVAMELVRGRVPAGHTNVVVDVAEPLLRRVMADVIGIPEWAARDFDTWVSAIVQAGSIGTSAWSAEVLTKAVVADAKIKDLVRMLLARRSELAPGSMLAHVAESGSSNRLDEHEIIVNARTLYTAGVHTTAPLIAASVYFLFDNYKLLTEARRDEHVVAAAVRETLRFASPAVEANVRRAKRDVVIAKHAVRRGQFVRTVILKANRDARRFDHPNEFNHRRRDQGKALGFGTGPHICLGNYLATAITEEICLALTAPWLDARMAEPRPEFRRRPSIPIMWGPGDVRLEFGCGRRSDSELRRTNLSRRITL